MTTFAAPRRVSAALGERALRTVSNVAAIGSAGGALEERVDTILDELRSLVPYEAVLLVSADPVSGAARPLALSGYSRELADYMTSAEFRTEMLEPFAYRLRGWPLRECDLPFDPLTLRPIAEHLRPAGYPEGLLVALTVPDQRDVGFLIMSMGDSRTPPSDEAITSIGCVSAVLGNLVDPLHDAWWAASVLAHEEVVVALLPDRSLVSIRGAVPGWIADPGSRMRRAVDRLVHAQRTDTSFTWLDDDGAWFRCRLLHCRDGIVVLTATRGEQLHRLTPRELEVLTHLAAGRTNDEIAAELVVTTRTVRAHVERLMDKLGVASRSGAVARAIREGLLVP
jgi:DNA-binding CsgD family transcriptional regulator